MGLPTIITVSVNPIIIVSTPTGITPTATISVIIARTVGTIHDWKPAVNIPFAIKLRPAGYLAGFVLSIGRFNLSQKNRQ
jgi:hypothetical protein